MCKCDDATITKYSGYPNNIYDNLSIDNEQKKGICFIMGGSDRIVSMLYINKILLHQSPTILLQGNQCPKNIEHIKERIANFTDFKEEVRRNEIICKNIQTSISSWEEDLKTVIEKSEMFFR